MTLPSRSEAESAEAGLDTLELELRKIEGVTGVGIESEGDRLLVDVLVVGGMQPPSGLRDMAEERCRVHTNRPFVVSINGLRGPEPGASPAPSASGGPTDTKRRSSRVRIDSIRPWTGPEESDGVEVVLVMRGRYGTGHGHRDVAGVASATILALRALRIEIPFEVRASEAPLPDGDAHAVVVLLEGTEGGARLYGVARARHPEDAAVRATLHALNRWLEPRILQVASAG